MSVFLMDIIFASAKLSNISAELAKSRLYRRIKKLGHFSCFSGQNSAQILEEFVDHFIILAEKLRLLLLVFYSVQKNRCTTNS